MYMYDNWHGNWSSEVIDIEWSIKYISYENNIKTIIIKCTKYIIKKPNWSKL